MTELDIIKRMLEWAEAGRNLALATVAQTWGSAPQPVGSLLLIDDKGEFEGSVSGGCVEGEVITRAADVIASGEPQMLTFGVADETAWQVGLACGGTIKIFVQHVNADCLENYRSVLRLHRARMACALVTATDTGKQRLVKLPDVPGDPQGEKVADRLRSDQSGLVGEDNAELVQVFNPALKLIITGAVHIAQALVPAARALGYDVTVIDPRARFASSDRFPGCNLLVAWPDEVLDGFDLDNRTAFAALTHDPKIDDVALKAALAGECFYIGALGSRRTHAKRLERLKGVDGVERISGPIGLDIGARGAPEIAVSIVAEMTAALRKA